MPFIGQEPITGAFHKLDAITTTSTNTYDLLLNGGAYSPASANHLMVSLNGVIQSPGSSFTISGSQITFVPSSGTLASSDSIDFIMAYGDVLNIGTPSDGTVSTNKLTNSAVTDAKMASGISASKLTTGTLPSTQMPVGSIIQVESTTVSGNLGAGTQDLVSVSITPTDNTNKILIMGSGLVYTPQGTVSAVDLYRDSTFIFRTTGGVGWGSPNANDNESFTPVFLDNPQTTNAITYKMQGLAISGSMSWGYYDSNNTGNTSITVMEVVV